jgi:hypothetical protein
MTARWRAAAALLALAAVGAGTAAGSASTGPATIRITDRQVLDKQLGDGVGAREIVRTVLYKPGREAIGQAALLCTWVAPRLRSCSGSFTLPRGTIVVAGLLSSRLLYELAIVGGTGLYDNARGTFTNTVLKLRPRRDLLLFRLTG